jgi:hypothetical protein
MKYLAAKYIQFDARDADAALKIANENEWDLLEGEDYVFTEDQLEVTLVLDKPAVY